ncbi:ArsR/SmtB family transcription factor [Phycicoccus flavus]|uniref:ArsR/SmtB family transcription factor n=1 Tax=Phycicoccus flavus TaxID=2502783 RepID=UPI00197C6261|nr:helix-turn-helix domain-containing protein [Phycicoccus flavus]
MDDGQDEVFRALADPTRRALLDALVARDGQTLFELCTRMADTGVTSSRQAISQHLDVLAAAGLVHVRRQGRYRLHDLDTTPLLPLRRRWLRPDERTDR